VQSSTWVDKAVSSAALTLALAFVSAAFATPDSPKATLIVNAPVVDGSGEPARKASLRIERDTITAVGDLTPAKGDAVVDAHGLILAPGFIDTHSHGDDDVFDHPNALAAVSQGITTIVSGQDGGSTHPLEDYFARLERQPTAVNVASYSGHGTLRSLVMKDDFKRAATAEEIRRMKELLGRDLDAGALGLSTGLEYDPGIYSSPEEVVALAKVASAAGGRYISHVRSEDRAFWKAIDEIIAIGSEARLPVQVSHIKLAMRSLWGRADELIGTLDRARASGVDVTAEIYPYTYWQSTLTVLFPERDFENKETAAFVLREIATPEGLLIDQFEPEPSYTGKTLAQISRLRGSDPPTALIDLIREAEALRLKTGDNVESVIGTSMAEPDIERLMAWPHTNLCTDGHFAGTHPRGFGAFTRVLGRYVRERKVVSLEEAVRKMTSLAAAHCGIRDRGLLKPGHKADLVLFDPEAVLDLATTDQPHALSRGVRTVWVAGEVVFDGSAATGKRPGRVLRR